MMQKIMYTDLKELRGVEPLITAALTRIRRIYPRLLRMSASLSGVPQKTDRSKKKSLYISISRRAVPTRPHLPFGNTTAAKARRIRLSNKKLTNFVAIVQERTISTERSPLVGDINANFCGQRVLRGQHNVLLRPYSRLPRPEPLLFLKSIPSIVLTRLSGPRSRPTNSQKTWQLRTVQENRTSPHLPFAVDKAKG
jgi:hypothetical protein